MCRHLTRRDSTIVSLHTHNDRGTGVAATELALLAGADRVEGTLFGNGERTGNLDIVTVALNLYTQGIHPGLDLSDLNAIRDVYERCTRLEVPPRQPYAGELVFTAFSGSHQDAIKKSLAHQKPGKPWDVLYIPIDPADIGRSYRAIIRINSQSGKGGVAYVLEQEFGYQLPKLMHKEIGRIVNDLADAKGTELTSADIRDASSASTWGAPRRSRSSTSRRPSATRGEVRGPDRPRRQAAQARPGPATGRSTPSCARSRRRSSRGSTSSAIPSTRSAPAPRRRP
jgi:2-isopropylmalate synthase